MEKKQAKKKIEQIYLLFNDEGISEGFAMTEKEAKERGYLFNDPYADKNYYEIFDREIGE